MKIKASVIEGFLTKIIDLENQQNKWINSLPNDISSVFFDNYYVTSVRKQYDETLKLVFGDWFDDLTYFLYEKAPHQITTDKNEYVINTVKEYVDYLVAEGFCEEDRK